MPVSIDDRKESCRGRLSTLHELRRSLERVAIGDRPRRRASMASMSRDVVLMIG